MSQAAAEADPAEDTTAAKPEAPDAAGGRKACWIVLAAVLAAVPFAMGKYSEFSQEGPFDSAAHVYSARHILAGARIGIAEKPSAQPGTLAVNIIGVWACGFSATGPKIIQTLLQAAALTVMFLAMYRLFGLPAAGVGVVVAALYLSSPHFAKFGNVKEQYMIAFMVLGVGFLIFRELGGRRLWAVLSGAALVWAPLFKPTGVTAIAAAGAFLLLQPLLKHKTWKQTRTNILLMFAGAAAALAPLAVWLASERAPVVYWPYHFVWSVLIPRRPGAGASYVAGSRQALSLARQVPIVLRFYRVLILPVALGLGAIVARAVKAILARTRRQASASAAASGSRFALLLAAWWALDMAFVWISPRYEQYYLPLNASAAMLGGYLIGLCADARGKSTGGSRFVLLLATWWALDMAFVWISPRSYEQYYLPLNASAVMLGGYLIGLCADARRKSTRRWTWNVAGLAGLLVMAGMAWQIVFGLRTDPQTGIRFDYKFKGYVQGFRRTTRKHREGLREHWEVVGDYIRENSRPDDTIYVWGWYPGIYVRAQRFSSAAKAFTSEMHVVSPETLGRTVQDLLTIFQDDPPKFIVDARMTHFPWNRRPLELWPFTSAGPLPNDPAVIARFDEDYYRELTEKVGRDEAERYKAMKPFRTFVMSRYELLGTSGTHVLLKHRRPR